MIRTRTKSDSSNPIQQEERLRQAKALLGWLCDAASKGLSKDHAELRIFESQVNLMLSCLFFRDVDVHANFLGPSREYVTLDIHLGLDDVTYLYVPVQFQLQP